jgi:hypothetical protein
VSRDAGAWVEFRIGLVLCCEFVVWCALKPCQLSDFIVRGFKSALDFCQGSETIWFCCSGLRLSDFVDYLNSQTWVMLKI